MRILLAYCGYEVDLTMWPFDLHVGPMSEDADEPEDCGCAKPRLGDSLSIPVGFSPSLVPEWEKPLNRWDEPDEIE